MAIYEALMATDDSHALTALLEHQPLAVWEELARRYPRLRGDLPLVKAVPVELLATLARDDDPRVRVMVAGKRKLSRASFELLAADCESWVRSSVARNPKVPSDVLAALVDDSDPDVAESAASHTARRSQSGSPRPGH